MRRFSLVPLIAAAAMLFTAIIAAEADGQLIPGRCFGPQCQPQPQVIYGPPVYQEYCPPPVYIVGPVEPAPAPVETAAASNWYSRLLGPGGRPVTGEDEKVIRGWAKRAVRIRNGNSCGTGSLCGRDETSIYILTNAHVAGSRIGHVVQCEALLAYGNGTETFSARVVEAAYSSRTSTDWALLKASINHMAGIEPIQLSTTPPDDDALTGTWGCPRCEIPSGQKIVTERLGSLWYWQPNSIGGQSGSAVVQGGQQKGLLTWTIGGDGAGQLTSTIYRQSREQNTDGPARVDGMETPKNAGNGVELVEGYHAEAGLHNYPIWAGNSPDPVDPTDPGVCPDVDPDTQRLLGLRDRLKDRGYDWAAIISLIIQLIDLFAKK